MRKWLLAFAVLSAGEAHASDLTDQLNRLVANGEMEQAYREAALHQQQLAGEPEFDLPYGIAAIDTGHINAGVFALERVLFLQPGNHRARLEYARGLFILGEDAQARQAFNRVLEEANPPPSVRDKVEQFLAAIRRRESRYSTSARAYVGLGLGYDSNINSAPDSQPSQRPIELALDRSDQYGRLIFGGQLFQPISKTSKLYGRWDSNLRYLIDETEHNNANHSLTLGGQWQLAQSQLDLSLNAQHYRLDGDSYRNLYGPTLQWSQALRADLTLQAGLSWLELNYPELSFRDARQLLLNVRAFGNLDAPLSPSWFTGLFYGDERSDAQTRTSRANVDRAFWGLQLGGQLNLSERLSLVGMAVYQDSGFAGDDLLYQRQRDEQYAALDLELKQLLTPHLQLSVNLNYSDNDSNIELYQYRRTQAGINVRYDF